MWRAAKAVSSDTLHSVRGDLVRMLSELVKTRRHSFDHIVIETTGLANPAPIIQTFFLEPSLQDCCRLDGVVTLVDAKHISMHLSEARVPGVVNEALEQIAFADRIILNKTDLSTPAALDMLEKRIGAINRLATVRWAQRGVVDVDYVLGIGGFDLDRITEAGGLDAPVDDGHSHSHGHSHEQAAVECADCGESVADGHSHEHAHEDEHAHSHSHGDEGCAECDSDTPLAHGHSHLSAELHDDAVMSVSLQQLGELDIDAVNAWLGDLLAESWQVRTAIIVRAVGVFLTPALSCTGHVQAEGRTCYPRFPGALCHSRSALYF